MKVTPTLHLEGALWMSGHNLIAGIDEVGRGAWAGPMTIGVTVVAAADGPFPDGLADSKMLTAKKRAAILPLTKDWVSDYATGEVSPSEIDALGVTAALRLASMRALEALTVTPDVVILDGDKNYLAATPGGTTVAFRCNGNGDGDAPQCNVEVPVVVQVKADATCASVSAASVIAKEHRDAQMREIGDAFPQYGFEKNVGYGGAQQHMHAVRDHGLTPHHRRSWNIPASARRTSRG